MKKLEEYVKGIRPYVKRIYITTSLPIDIVNDYDRFERIMKDIDGLNVSLQHYSDELNNYAMRASRPHMRINSLLKRICSKEEYANKVRVSINLVKGYIDSEEKLDEFLRKMISIHVNYVKINKLQHEEELFVEFEGIFKGVLNMEGIELKSPYAQGCQQEVAISKYRGLKITLKRACFCVNNNLYANFADMMKAFHKSFRKKQSSQTVLYEDGTLSHGWHILEK